MIFHVEDLVEQVQTGKFREAYCYVRVYAPLDQSSDEAELLALFLEDLMAISSFAQGDIMVAGIVCDWFKNLYKRPLLSSKYPCFASLVADVLFLRSNHVRYLLSMLLLSSIGSGPRSIFGTCLHPVVTPAAGTPWTGSS